eukprot:2779284-Rhodomonas_salina.5
MRCPLLTYAMLLRRRCAMRCWNRVCWLRLRYATCGTEQGYAATRRVYDTRRERERAQGYDLAIVLRICYAVSGTGIAHGAICYAMFGTGTAYGAVCYAMSGTDVADLLCGVRY